MPDFYDGMSEDTLELLKKAQMYTQLALDNGDVAVQEKPREIIIKLRVAKKEKKDV